MSKKVPILLEFGRGWCIPCKYMKPILDDMSAAYTGKAIVMTVDMDVNKDLVRDFRIRMMQASHAWRLLAGRLGQVT